MIHFEEVLRLAPPVKEREAVGRVGIRSAVRRATLLLLAGAAVACDGTSATVPGDVFGQSGSVRAEVRTPTPGGEGELHETLVWHSDGRWVLSESVTYRGVEGAETVRYSRLNPGELALEYASLVQQLNETPGLRLLSGAVPEDLIPVCDPGVEPQSLPTQVTMTIRDSDRDETARWVRCASGTLFSFTPGESGPDDRSARVITAAQLMRSFTVGDGALSTYQGTLPYGTVDRGEHSPATPQGSKAFVSDDGEPPEDFVSFWADHTESPLPNVDWGAEMVLLAAVGERVEAGSVVRIRRVLPIGSSTRVELVERVAGDFCSPLERPSHPYHLVVVPDLPLPIEFTPPQVERVPCGA